MGEIISMADVQSVYGDPKQYNLLIPESQSRQLNPFYKITITQVNLAPRFDPSGNDENRYVYKQKGGAGYSLTKVALYNLATAAGIQFDPMHTSCSLVAPDVWQGTATAMIQMTDGSWNTTTDTKTIDLTAEEKKLRLEFENKAKNGLTDREKIKAAMDEGYHGRSLVKTNAAGQQFQAFVIDEADRQNYIEKSVLVNMANLRANVAEKAMTGAKLRVIRSLLGIKSAYPLEDLRLPFIIPKVSFAPDYTDPQVRSMAIAQGMSGIGSLFGGVRQISVPAYSAPAPQIASQEPINPAYQSDEIVDSDTGEEPATQAAPEAPVYQNSESAQNDTGDWMQDQAAQAAASSYVDPELPWGDPSANKRSSSYGHGNGSTSNAKATYTHTCADCGKGISDKVFDYSQKRFGRPLCYDCQKKVKG